MIVRFVDINGIVDYHSLNFLHMESQWCHLSLYKDKHQSISTSLMVVSSIIISNGNLQNSA